MALKRLTAQEMIQLSSPWTSPQDPARTTIEKVPMLGALLPRLEAAHKALFGGEVAHEDPRARILSQTLAEHDATHDGLVRGIWVALSALAELSPSSEELLRLRDMLLPEGLEHTRKTYRGESGHAAMVASRLDQGARARLANVTLHDKNLLDLVDAWLASAQKIGQLEDERARLAAPTGTTAGQMNTARLTWVRVVNAFVAIAELAELGETDDRLLFANLRAAERTADSRRRPSSAGANASGSASSAGGPAPAAASAASTSRGST